MQLKHARLHVLGVTVPVVLSLHLFCCVTLTGGNLLSIWLEPLTVEGSENRTHFWRFFAHHGNLSEAWQLPTTCGDRTDLRHLDGLHGMLISSICLMENVWSTSTKVLGPPEYDKKRALLHGSPSVLDSVAAGSIRIHCFVVLLPRVHGKRAYGSGFD